MDSLGEDLALLSVSPADGRVTTAQKLGFGLMGSELVRLAAAGRLTITAGRVTVTDPPPRQRPGLHGGLPRHAGRPRPGPALRGVRPRPARPAPPDLQRPGPAPPARRADP